VIEGCFFINLPQRTDRLAQLQASCFVLRSMGIEPERLEAICGKSLAGYAESLWFGKRLTEKRKNAWAGKAGCTLSHRKAIAEAKKRGWKNVLILEDDCVIEPGSIKQWEAFFEIVETLPVGWVAVYLYGHHPVLPVRLIQAQDGTACYELCGASSTTAYLLNGQHFDALLARLPKEETVWPWTARYKTIDRWYSRTLCLLGQVYAFSPFCISHRETISDIATSGVTEPAPTFCFTHFTSPSHFYVRRQARVLLNRLALGASIFRYWGKKIRGL
jgi:glycosyl transferase, family 25